MKFEAIMNDEASFSTDHNESILKLDSLVNFFTLYNNTSESLSSRSS